MNFDIPIWVKALIIAGLIAAAVFGIGVYNSYQQEIGYDRAKLEMLGAENTALKDALVDTRRLNQKVEEAQNAARDREVIIQQQSARIGTLTGRLRDAESAIRAGLPGASPDALRNAVGALDALFAECRGRYAEVGKAAAGHSSDVKTLTAGWPRQQ